MLSVTDQQLIGWITSLLFPMFRILALMTSAPLLSQRGFPVRTRVALSGVIAVLVSPFSGVPSDIDAGSTQWFELGAREVLIGLAIGFAARLMFAAFEMAGEIIGLQMGLSFAGYFDPAAGQANAVGRMLNALSMLTFVSMNGPLLLLVVVIRSFSVIPVQPGVPTAWASLSPMQLGTDLFGLALTLALPFMVLLLFINLVLGVMSRVAPQFNVFAVGFPVTIGAGLVLLSTGFPLIEQPLAQAVARLLSMLG